MKSPSTEREEARGNENERVKKTEGKLDELVSMASSSSSLLLSLPLLSSLLSPLLSIPEPPLLLLQHSPLSDPRVEKEGE